jgi:hypothetical protein
MRKAGLSVWAAGFYFLISSIVFFLGASGKIDGFFWGFLSFIIDWPFSVMTRYVWRNWIDSLNLYDVYLTPLRLYAPHLIAFFLDVVLGTVWWWMVSFLILILSRRLRGSRSK